MANVHYPTGKRVRNLKTNTAVPFGGLGTVVDGPSCTYGVTVLWDDCQFFASHGERGWRPYWDTNELEAA